MAARTSGKKSKAAKSSSKKPTRKGPAKKGTAKKAAGKKATKKAAAKTGAKATKKKASPKAKSVKKASLPTPAGTGMLVHTRIAGVAKRLLGPSTTAGGISASGGISHTNPARSAMLRRLLG
jgi:hypothetical protein